MTLPERGLKPYMIAGIPEAGCDEAGRGCLCGPVSCAAVILPPDFKCPELNDSKKLTERLRKKLRPIIEREALAWAVVMVSAEEIDRINILNASIEGMHRALNALKLRPAHIIVDGNKFRPYCERISDNDMEENLPSGIIIPHHTVVKGDGKFMSIAAASVLAKTHRDELMENLAERYPGYGWEINKGYPTKAHREAILSLGPTPLHRISFRLT